MKSKIAMLICSIMIMTCVSTNVFALSDSSAEEKYITQDVMKDDIQSYSYDNNDAESEENEGNISLTADDADNYVTGIMGDNVTWSLDKSTGKVIISGTGDMYDYSYFDNKNPLKSYMSYVKSVVINKGVTSIGDYAFYYCGSLTEIEVPEGVTSIGASAFRDCSSLTEIEIPKGVTSIGNSAFSNCRSLTEIEIPEGITNIRDSTFSYCKSLTEIKIPEGVTSIGDYAFYYCISLTEIEIPKGITNIRDYAFRECSSLTEIKIPEGVTSIGVSAFYNCSSLTEIEIPEGVTSIELLAFSNCRSLIEIEIPEGVTSIGDYAFFNCRSLTEIEIPEGVTSIGNGAFYSCISLTEIEIPEGVTSIVNSTFYYCTSLTEIKIPKSLQKIDDAAFDHCSALKDVYYAGSKSDFEKIDMPSDAFGSATIHYNASDNVYNDDSDVNKDFAIIKYNGNSYNLLSQSININKDSSAEVSVKVNYENASGDEKIYITQGVENYVELENNVYKVFKPAEIFDNDKDIYILILNEKTGESISKRTYLKIIGEQSSSEWMPNGDTGGLNFKLGKETSFTIPENVPVFGGAEIKWDFDFIPISVEYDHEDSNKINIVFGTNIVHSENKNDKWENKWFEDFDFKKYKEKLKKAASKQKRTLKQLKSDFGLSNDSKMNLFDKKVFGGGPGKGNFDVDVLGYAEAKIINGQLRFIEGQICLEAEISYTYQGQLFIWTIPVYYEIGGGISAELEGNVINIDPESFEPEFEAYLTSKIKAELGAGVGIPKAASVGVAGEGALNLKTALHKEYFKAWGEGSANFNVKIFGKKVAQKDFLKGEFLIYETGNSNGLINDYAVNSIDDSEENESGAWSVSLNAVYNNIDINSIYENENRQYALSSTKWYGNENNDISKERSIDDSNKSTNLLAENVYTESAPIICSIDGKKIMVMLWDDAERDDVNRTMLVYSVYDDETDSWSNPVPVYDDGTADFYPCFNDGYLVWQNEKSLLTDSMTLLEIAELGEIYAAKWNGNGFDTPVAITENGDMDSLPYVCASDSEVSVVWVTNSENDIIGISGVNSIMKSDFNGSVWSTPEIVKSDLNAIISLSAGYVDSELNIAYVADDDNNLQAADDRDICIISTDKEYKLTDNDVLDSNPVFAGDKVYYYSNGNIEYSILGSSVKNKVFDESKSGLTDNFTISVNESGDTALFWVSMVDNDSEVFAALCKDGEWSDEIQISETGNYSKYPSGILEADGTIYIAYNNGIWQDGEIVQSDLYTMEIIPAYDLSVTDAYIDEDSMVVYAVIKNSGEINVDSYTLTLIDGDVNSTKNISEELKAGESAEVEIEFVKPEDLDKRIITFNVSIDKDEYNLDNNSVELNVGSCDLEVVELKSYEKLPASSVTAVVSNSGYSDTGNVNIYLRSGTVDGEVLQTKSISNLSAGENVEVAFDYNICDDDNIQWYVTAEAENDEISLSNNDLYLINDYAASVSDYSQEILRYDVKENAFVVNTYTENNTNEAFSGASILAVYDSAGKLKCIERNDLDVNKYGNSAVDFVIDDYAKEAGDYMKLFLCNGINSMTPVCESKSIAV